MKSFTGATTTDMKHYVQPTLEKKPDRIILHVGTNDLKTTDSSKVAESITDLARNIESTSQIKVSISQFTTRRDLSEKVKEVNKHLKRFESQNEWQIINNNNILDEDLNKGELHLTDTGTKKLFYNFTNFINNN